MKLPSDDYKRGMVLSTQGVAEINRNRWPTSIILGGRLGAESALSPAFVSSVEDFVAGKSIKDYFPTEEEEKEILAHIREKELLEDDL